MSEWRTDLPPKAGYYEADFGPMDDTMIVWLIPVKAESPDEEDGIVWGFDEHDDPEAVELDTDVGYKFRWREINHQEPTP